MKYLIVSSQHNTILLIDCSIHDTYIILIDCSIHMILRGRPQLLSFTSMIIPIVRGGRGLKDDDNYHNILPLGNFFVLVSRPRK